VNSTRGDYVLRGKPNFTWQFPTEQFYARFLYERANIPAPWPYFVDPTPDIFGWSYVLMPRMPGLQLADPQVREQLSRSDRLAIARALGENLAAIQEVKWPHSGRYRAASGAVEAFELAHELAWPLPVESEPDLAAITPMRISYSQRVQSCLRRHLAKAREANTAATTQEDIAWVERLLEEANVALNDTFAPCLVLEDYKEANLVVLQHGEGWRVSGVFDLMGAYFGDGEADLSRQYAEYLDEDPPLAREFLHGYLSHTTARPGFVSRFPIYMLLDRAMTWHFIHCHIPAWWDGQQTFRDWASRYFALPVDG
jgi:hygromycin-B 7''-O-kinase